MTTDRRTVLRGFAGLAAGAGLAGCGAGSGSTPGASQPPSSTSTTDPDTAAMLAAAQGEARLLAGYDRAIAAAGNQEKPALQVARALHAIHLQALRDAGAPTPTSVTPIHRLRAAELSSATRLQRFAVGLQAADHAALLASIAAAHRAVLL